MLGCFGVSYLDRETKKELLDFLTKLEAEQALAKMEEVCDMTEQKAIETLEYIRYCNDYKGCREAIALDVAIKALEKQISKKVEVWADGSEHCPCCDKNNSGLCFPVCIECGQKLDWGEQNERT